MAEKDRTSEDNSEGFAQLRNDIEKLVEADEAEFKKNLQTVLKNMVAVVETVTVELKSGQETSAKAFQAIAEVLKSLTQKFGN